MYITVGDPILVLGPTYDNFRLTSQAQGAVVNYFNYENDFSIDENKFIKTINQLSPSLVYICNPNNPSGNLLSKQFLKKIIQNFPETIFLVDEAYYEFSGHTIADEVVNFPNLFVSRTFSKAFGIANFRAGYLISDVNNIQQLSKIRNPKNFTTFAQEAVIAVLSDVDYMEKYVVEVNEAKEWFSIELTKLDFIDQVFESHANFVLVKFKSFDVKMNVYNKLIENNIFVRNLLHSDLLINTLRISIGTKEQMNIVIDVLKKVK
jgi:histidinol-phosphate aminotransferase